MGSPNSNKRGVSPGPRHHPPKGKHHKDFDLKIGARIWRVQFVGNEEISSPTWGDCNLSEGTTPKICVYRCQSKRKLMNELLSEVLQAIHREWGKSKISAEETAEILERAMHLFGYKLN